MNQKLFSFFFLFALALPLQMKAEPVPGILGNWIAEETIYGRDVMFRIGFSFTEDRAHMSVQCAYRNGQLLETSATAAAQYDGNNIYITERNEGQVSDGFFFCRATLDRSRWEAYFDGTGKMVLFVPVPYQARFTLIKDIPGDDDVPFFQKF